jgi:carboxymethylenebutenolidase
MDQNIIDLYDEFTHGGSTRREFMQRLAMVAGGMPAAIALLQQLENDYTKAVRVAESDERIVTSRISYKGASGDVTAYFAAPAGKEKRPAVVVIHENRGLNAHIEDVARRVAVGGFLAIAPDALSASGGTPADQDAARTKIGELDAETAAGDFVAAVEFGKTHARSTGKVGCVGFCWGGAMANQLAVRCSDLRAAVAFYGRQAAVADVPKIKAALQFHYAGLDERINGGIAEYEAALKTAGVRYDSNMYDGKNHAFHNDTSPNRYDADAAALAWKRTIEFFEKHLG